MDPDDPVWRINYALSGTTVCDRHLDDDYLRDWVAANLTACSCDYCDRQGDQPIAADLAGLAEVILHGLQSFWQDSTEEVPPGLEYTGARSTEELLYEEGVSDEQKLIDDLRDAFSDYGWVHHNFFGLTPSQRLRSGWEGFVEAVKHHSRYFFGFSTADPNDPDDLPPIEILNTIGTIAQQAGLLTTWVPETHIYRARPRNSGEHFTDSWDLAALPLDKADLAAANRMSAAGVPMFYGALDAPTAAAETRNADPKGSAPLGVGEFETTAQLRILDLSQRFEIPSTFDPDNSPDQAALAFLRDFVADLSKPVTRDGLEHIEYVPTQVVCEFLRSVFQTQDQQPLDGIAYRSAQAEGGICVVLFIGNDEVANSDGSRPPRPAGEGWLGEHLRPEAKLVLVQASET